MTRYEYDDAASAALHMDVVHEVDDSPAPVCRCRVNPDPLVPIES
ncbi:hypothetical protein [Nocardioides sp.]